MPGKLKWGGVPKRGGGVTMAWEGAVCHLQNIFMTMRHNTFIFLASEALHLTLYHADQSVFRNFSHGC